MTIAQFARPTLVVLLAFSGANITFAQLQNSQALETAKRQGRYDRTIDLLLDDDSLLPGVMELPEGQYRFVVHNNFSRSALTLRIDDDDKKERVRDDQPVTEKAIRADLVVDLKPGKYRIYVAERQRWQCVVTVTKKTK